MVNLSLPTSSGRKLRRQLVLGLLAATTAMPLVKATAYPADVPATQPAATTATRPASPSIQPVVSLAPSTRPIVDLRKSVEFLASEDLEGRGSGSPGIDIAAGYIASTYSQI